MLKFVCKDTALEASDYLDGHMAFTRKLQMYGHLLLCIWCRRFLRQFKLAAETAAHEAKQAASQETVQKIVDAAVKDTSR